MRAVSRFRRNFFDVARANLFAQVILLAATPLLTRIYTPEDFGVAALFIAAFQIVVSVSTWRFDWSLPNARSHADAASLLVAGAVALGVVCTLTLLVVLNAERSLGWWNGQAALGRLLWLLPVALLGGGLVQLLQGWFVREGDLGPVSKVKVHQSIGNLIVSLLGGFIGLGPGGLIAGLVVGSWLGLATLVANARRVVDDIAARSAADVGRVSKLYLRECTLSTGVSLVNAVSLSAAVVLLSQVYSPGQVGLYALMTRLATAPLSAFSIALAQSFWARAAELARAGEFERLRRAYLKVTGVLFLASLGVAAVCLAGPLFVGRLFGATWQPAGSVLAALAPMLMSMVMFSPTNHLIVLGRQGLQLIADSLRLGLMLLAMSLAHIWSLTFLQAVIALSFASATGYILLFAVHLSVHRGLTRTGERPS